MNGERQVKVIRPGIDVELFNRYLELVQHEVDSGRRLPLSPLEIMLIEDRGGIVDLETGAVSWPKEVNHE